MARGTAQRLSNFGWSKEKVKSFLWENSKIPFSLVAGDPYLRRTFLSGVKERVELVKIFGFVEGEPLPIAPNPKNIILVVAGGTQSGHGYWMRVGASSNGNQVTKEVRLPANQQDLLKKAEEDLGPAPAF